MIGNATASPRIFGTGGKGGKLQAAALLAALLAVAAGARADVTKAAPAPGDKPSSVLLDAMSAELSRAMASLGKSPAESLPPYFLSYSVTDGYTVRIAAQYGALLSSAANRQRSADVVVRVGDPALDNTHGAHRASALNSVRLPLTDDRVALERSLWWITNGAYGNALNSYLQVKTETQVRAKEEDVSADFTREEPRVAVASAAPAPVVDRAQWEGRLRQLSAIFRGYPEIYSNVVSLEVENSTNYFLSSEGARVVSPHRLARLVVYAGTRAEDGMELYRAQTFEAASAEELPSVATIEGGVRKLAESLEALRKAPVTEPFDGPAILSGRAAAVFFHEVLGHRLEGQRQRGNEEGQTFTRDLGKPILPEFLSVEDDPGQTVFGKTYLSGAYQFDDEGQRAAKVDLVENGVLKGFLMSRLPVAGFARSNGHGRSQPGRMPTGRQGNLIVSSSKTVTDAELRQMLIAEAKKQGKPYGLYFEDISSGFAVTSRSMPQAFQVLPLVVYRVYTDGRPDELVRGVSIVGTPLAALSRIAAASGKREVFNGECGAESGSIPVSAIAPAMLVTEIETQRQPQGSARPPILPMPDAVKKAE